MKKKILGQTIMFIFIVLFVSGFARVFGEVNTLIGVSTIVATLVLLEKDLTKKPIVSFLELLGTNLLMGVLSFLAVNNIWLGIVINFVVLVSVGYVFSYNLTKRIIIPFGLQYLFLVSNPVDIDGLPVRLISLIVGAVIVMISQFIVNSKKTKHGELEESLLYSIGEDENDDKEVKLFGKIVNVHPVRAGYAIRVGILTSLTIFISTYFEIAQGHWITFTVFSLTEFYSEHCKIRSKQRMQGTLIGVLITIIIFMLVEDPSIRGLVVLMAGYMNPFANNYRDLTICVTVSSVASVALTNGTIEMAIARVLCVVVGVIIALIANKYILKNTEDMEYTEDVSKVG